MSDDDGDDLLPKLSALDATIFENLTYDLVTLRGLRNITWRTPGADGGRDIEGRSITTDFSGEMNIERWYIECKRYSVSVDWPTVYAKIPYAHNHQADALLLCTTSSLSPKCRDEVALYNDKSPKLRIRSWDGARLEQEISREPLLLAKYKLRNSASSYDAAIGPMMNLACKFAHAAQGEAGSGANTPYGVECVAATLELVSARAHAASHGLANDFRPFRPTEDVYDWCSLEGELPFGQFDRSGLRAILAAIRYFARLPVLPVKSQESASGLILEATLAHSKAASNASQILGVWANIEIRLENDGVWLNWRESP